MKTMVPDHSIVVIRDGKQVTALPNKPFDFTADEIKEVLGKMPDSLREPINETSTGENVERGKVKPTEAELAAEAARQKEEEEKAIANAAKSEKGPKQSPSTTEKKVDEV